MAIASTFMTLDDTSENSSLYSLEPTQPQQQQYSQNSLEEYSNQLQQAQTAPSVPMEVRATIEANNQVRAERHDSQQLQGAMTSQMNAMSQNQISNYANSHNLAPPSGVFQQTWPNKERQTYPKRETYVDVVENTTMTGKLWDKRREVTKLVILTFVILLAMSTHGFVCHYLKDYFINTPLSFWKEVSLRALYPVFVFITMWLTKASISA